ncbi:MAG TPA: glutaredoxin family protein [Gaiellaceae bacterium]|nr:glutaredoxin family protein [Gaiellaceae bacterium]
MKAVTLYYAQDCSLCEDARVQLERLQTEVSFELEEIDITGVPELEARYREWLPVVEVDGERAFVYRIDEAELLQRLAG